MSVFHDHSTLKKRALGELSKAFEASRGELSCDWVISGDLDLASLRHDPALLLVLGRYCGSARPKSADGDEETAWSSDLRAYLAQEETRELRGYPERPWGDPERRATSWVMLVVATIEAAILLAILTAPHVAWVGLIVLIALAALATVRGSFSWREARRTDAAQQARRLIQTTEGDTS